MSVEDSAGAGSSRAAREDHEVDNGNDDEYVPPTTYDASGPVLGVSTVQYLGPSTSYCGYCKRSERQSGAGRQSYNMLTYALQPADYQDLLDRNWRRSGTYSYCPINQTTCCPNYPIICTATEFQLTRSHRKCIAKVNSYLATGDIKQNINLDYSKQDFSDCANKTQSMRKKVVTLDEVQKSSKSRDKRFLRACEKRARVYDKTIGEAMRDIREKWDDKNQPTLPMECYLFPKKTTLNETPDRQQSENQPHHPPLKPKHVLKIDMISVHSKECNSLMLKQHEMLKRYQSVVHNDDADREWTLARFFNFLVKTPIIQEPLDEDEFDHATGKIIGHPDDTFSPPYSRHLTQADKYLLVRPPQLPTAYGTYHCNYYLDDKLIATGVLDVLPKCITTVYFFYDPDYGFLNLGIYSALIEISMIRQMDRHYKRSHDNYHSDSIINNQNPLVNYYLGFYVHECRKMHYKTRFRPAYLLCSKSLTYVPIDVCLKKLKDRKYADFADNQQQQPQLQKSDIVRLLNEDRFNIIIVPPIVLPDPFIRSYINWLSLELGPAYMDLFLNGVLVPCTRLVGYQLLSRLQLQINVAHHALVERFKRLTNVSDAQIADIIRRGGSSL